MQKEKSVFPNKLYYYILLLVLASSCQNDISYYVSPSGNDNHSGTIEKPFATIQKALELSRESKKKKITIYLREGTYYLNDPVIFTPEDSRNEQADLTICKYGDEKVIVSGAKKLSSLKWDVYKDKIMKTPISGEISFDQLFVNGQLQHMARYPNFDPDASHYNGIAADAIAPERVSKWNNPAGGYVHASHRHEWGGYHWIIKSKNENNELELEGGWQNNRLMGMHPERRFVENIFEELDAPGEWFFDASTHTLYLYPTIEMDLTTATLETPQIECLFEFCGSESAPVQNIHIEGLELTHTLRTFMDTREQLLRSDWAIYRNATILFEGAKHCSVRNCFFNTVGGNAVFFSNYNRHNDVSGCHIADTGANGICFVGDPDAVRSPSFEYNEFVPLEELDRNTGPKTNNYPAECRIYDNLMYRLGRVEKQVAGVQISMAQDITVSHNTIYDVPRAGINISEGTWGGHIIEHNEVFNTVLETGDHGSFNSWGRDRFWHPDYATLTEITKNHPELILLDAVKTTIIRNNRFRCDHGWDIDLDDGSSNYHIYNNVCLNGGLKLREGFHRTVENNIMINNSFHPHVWFPNSGDVFVRNIVSTGYFPIRVNEWGKEVDYNIFPDKTALDKAQENGTDQHSVYGNVQYIDPQHGDFRVKDGSIAFSVGFKNFEMDKFGVVSPELKKLAKQVPIPELIYLDGNEEGTQEVLGMKIKNITTLGERSAAGLSDASGVWIVEVSEGSPVNGILQPNDVIIKINHMPVRNIREMKEALIRVKNKIFITISRNQQEQEFTINR
ncbi:MAG: PDZ domain-containing protein [Tannerella sp.]|jgi:hypothetical protein|nr:PDZ domain-containing protein [Tannerella sp.]